MSQNRDGYSHHYACSTEETYLPDFRFGITRKSRRNVSLSLLICQNCICLEPGTKVTMYVLPRKHFLIVFQQYEAYPLKYLRNISNKNQFSQILKYTSIYQKDTQYYLIVIGTRLKSQSILESGVLTLIYNEMSYQQISLTTPL